MKTETLHCAGGDVRCILTIEAKARLVHVKKMSWFADCSGIEMRRSCTVHIVQRRVTDDDDDDFFSFELWHMPCSPI